MKTVSGAHFAWLVMWVLSFAIFVSGCASAPPSRYVIEHDLGSFAYRRYQKTLDIEVPIEGNDAVGHTASYIERRGESEANVAVTTAFVTVYQRAPALAAEVRARLQKLTGYQLSVRELDGAYVWQLDGGKNERWAVWVSDRYVVKIGAPAGEEFPEPVASAYLDTYASDLNEHGLAKPGSSSAGVVKMGSDGDEPERQLPASLREGAPR